MISFFKAHDFLSKVPQFSVQGEIMNCLIVKVSPLYSGARKVKKASPSHWGRVKTAGGMGWFVTLPPPSLEGEYETCIWGEMGWNRGWGRCNDSHTFYMLDISEWIQGSRDGSLCDKVFCGSYTKTPWFIGFWYFNVGLMITGCFYEIDNIWSVSIVTKSLINVTIDIIINWAHCVITFSCNAIPSSASISILEELFCWLNGHNDDAHTLLTYNVDWLYHRFLLTTCDLIAYIFFKVFRIYPFQSHWSFMHLGMLLYFEQSVDILHDVCEWWRGFTRLQYEGSVQHLSF